MQTTSEQAAGNEWLSWRSCCSYDRKPFGAAEFEFRCAGTDPVGELAVEAVDQCGVGIGQAAWRGGVAACGDPE